MKIKNFLILALAILGFSNFSNAQKITKGYVKYEITDFTPADPNDPQMNMVASMIKGTVTKLYFDGDEAYTKISAMGGSQVTKILKNKDGSTDLYMDIMGQKIHTKITKEEQEKLEKEQGDKKPEYVHHKDKTKKILGFDTHLVTVKPEEGKEEAEVELWVTDQIQTDGTVQQGWDNKDFEGFPLEYTIKIKDQFSMTTKATEFKKDFDKSVFNFDKTGYKDLTIDQLKNMGGGGF